MTDQQSASVTDDLTAFQQQVWDQAKSLGERDPRIASYADRFLFDLGLSPHVRPNTPQVSSASSIITDDRGMDNRAGEEATIAGLRARVDNLENIARRHGLM
jgi:hypothetical protein